MSNIIPVSSSLNSTQNLNNPLDNSESQESKTNSIAVNHIKAPEVSVPESDSDNDDIDNEFKGDVTAQASFVHRVSCSSQELHSSVPLELALKIENQLDKIFDESFALIHEHMAEILKPIRNKQMIEDTGIGAMLATFDKAFSRFIESDFDKIKKYVTANAAADLDPEQKKLVCKGCIVYLDPYGDRKDYTFFAADDLNDIYAQFGSITQKPIADPQELATQLLAAKPGEISDAIFALIHKHMATILKPYKNRTNYNPATEDTGLAAMIAKFDRKSWLQPHKATPFQKIEKYATQKKPEELAPEKKKLVCQGFVEYLNHMEEFAIETGDGE